MNQHDWQCIDRIGFTLWLTGLPCAGKSTLGLAIRQELMHRKIRVALLDGDALRQSLCCGLGFTASDRDENVRRIGEVCDTLWKRGVSSVVAVVSPYRHARENLRRLLPNFIEVYVKAPLAVCIKRDVKGMYARALSGDISHFTGIDDPYEEPLSPDIIVDTATTSVEDSVGLITTWLERAGYIASAVPPGLPSAPHTLSGARLAVPNLDEIGPACREHT